MSSKENARDKTGDLVIDSLFQVQRINQFTTSVKFNFITTLIIIYQGRHVSPALLALLPVIGSSVALFTTYLAGIASKKINSKGTWRASEKVVLIVDLVLFGPIMLATMIDPSAIIYATFSLAVFYPLAKAFGEFDARMIKQHYFTPFQIHEWEAKTQRYERIAALFIAILVYLLFELTEEQTALFVCTVFFLGFNLIDIYMSHSLIHRLTRLYQEKGQTIVQVD